LPSPVDLRSYVPAAIDGPFAALLDMAPWEITSRSKAIVTRAISGLAGYDVADGVAIHRKASVEKGAVIKGPAIIGPGCFVAATSYLRDGVFLDEDCIIGPACELKSVFMLKGSKLAHLSFVGDSIIGAGANIEAGAMIANYRNERAEKRIRIRVGESDVDTGVEKFGAVIGDNARVGANAVIAPGALIAAGAVVPRLALVDQSME
jgi:UDP-N-acetylglucosamine diphosphorylase / glucose-1-phosphate thymidylyltransferase / UDP-N-acetylgalactosamine diphosphorylase / glucosamine-1-phosphate N-acetyltransferase / galactosamine-1-phosphate N-acetyltransferase